MKWAREAWQKACADAEKAYDLPDRVLGLVSLLLSCPTYRTICCNIHMLDHRTHVSCARNR